MKVIQNYSLDIESVEMLDILKEKAGKPKSELIREFIKYFTIKEEEFKKLIQGDKTIEQE